MPLALCIVSVGADLGMAVNKETSACGTSGMDHVAIGRQNSQKMFSAYISAKNQRGSK
jgi:hypothetical protein